MVLPGAVNDEANGGVFFVPDLFLPRVSVDVLEQEIDQAGDHHVFATYVVALKNHVAGKNRNGSLISRVEATALVAHITRETERTPPNQMKAVIIKPLVLAITDSGRWRELRRRDGF